MLSLLELERAARVLDAGWRGARLDRVVAPGDFELVLHLAGGEQREAKERLFLLLCWRPVFARVAALSGARPAPATPPALAQFLKPRLEGTRLREVSLRGGDRQLLLVFDARDGTRTKLVLSLMGPRSNLYVLDQGELLVRSARPLADTRRELVVGEPFRDPEGGPTKPPQDRFEGVADEDLLAAIEAEYGAREEREQGDRLHQQLRQALKKQRAALERKARALERDLQGTEESPTFERWGELLKSHMKQIRPGADSVDAVDHETGETVTIPLDPKLSGPANLDLLFKRARKAMKRGVRAAQDLDGLRERERGLDALDEDFAAIDENDDGALRGFAERADVARMLDRFLPKVPKPSEPTKPKKVWKIGKRELPTRLVPKRYLATGGLEIWVGKNDEGNDVLTTRLARGRDLFFHLEGSPGSHVILRVGKGEPPHEALLEAAELAVQFSKGKNASKAPVHVAECKDITKPKGAKHGLVYVHRGRTIQLRRDPERLKRITAARIED